MKTILKKNFKFKISKKVKLKIIFNKVSKIIIQIQRNKINLKINNNNFFYKNNLFIINFKNLKTRIMIVH